MKGICHVWSRGRHFSPSLPDDRYLNLGSKSDLRAEISGSIVWYDALAPRPEVLLSFSAFYANNVFGFSTTSLRKLLFSKLKKCTKILSLLQHGKLFRATFCIEQLQCGCRVDFSMFSALWSLAQKRSFLRIFPYHSLCKTTIFATFQKSVIFGILLCFWAVYCIE